MSELEAAAPAPAPETAVETAPDLAAMEAVWAKHQDAAEAPEAPAEAEPGPAAAEAAPEPEPAPAVVIEAPSDLPASLKDGWSELPEKTRDAIVSTQREFSRKLADQGRIVQATKPVYDVLIDAAKEMPTLANMTPAEIARDMFPLARVMAGLRDKPVETILGVAQKYGAIDQLRAALTGAQAPTNDTSALMRQIEDLKRAADPKAIEQRVHQTIQTTEATRLVSDYAASKEHWGAVEAVMPQMVQMAQQMKGPGASARDVLDTAYDMAVHAIPDLRAKVIAPAQAQAAPDPARAEAALRAKSVNVSGKPSSQAPQTERQAMEAVWAKYRS
jgi:hypothetical protein